MELTAGRLFSIVDAFHDASNPWSEPYRDAVVGKRFDAFTLNVAADQTAVFTAAGKDRVTAIFQVLSDGSIRYSKPLEIV